MARKSGIQTTDEMKDEMRRIRVATESKTRFLKILVTTTAVFAGLALAIIVFGGWYYVPGGENGVMLNRVEIDGYRGYGTQEIAEGLYFKYPIVQSVTKLSYRTQTLNFCNKDKNQNIECEYGQLIPKDINGVNFDVDVTVRYHIAQDQIAEFVRFKGPTMKFAEEIVKTSARADSTRGIFGRYAQEEVPAIRNNISIMVMKELQDRINLERTGDLRDNFIVIEAVDIRNIDFNPEIEDRIIQKLKKKQLAEEKVFDIEIAEKRSQEEIILANKDAMAQIIRANGTATAIRLEAFAKADGIEAVNLAYQGMPMQFVYTKAFEAILPTDKMYFGFDSLSGNQLSFLDMNQLMAARQSQGENE